MIVEFGAERCRRKESACARGKIHIFMKWLSYAQLTFDNSDGHDMTETKTHKLLLLKS